MLPEQRKRKPSGFALCAQSNGIERPKFRHGARLLVPAYALVNDPGQRLGRRKQQNWRASQAFDVTLKKLAAPRGKQRLEITWQRQTKFADWSQRADGCYLLRSHVTGVDAARLWRRYLQRTEAEGAFRITQDELAIRPIWHPKEDRVKAHILVCFLAYSLGKTRSGWMRGAGLGDAPRTLRED